MMSENGEAISRVFFVDFVSARTMGSTTLCEPATEGYLRLKNPPAQSQCQPSNKWVFLSNGLTRGFCTVLAVPDQSSARGIS